jgi:magnesium transporter
VAHEETVLCIVKGKVAEGNNCKNSELIRYKASRPNWCKRSFQYTLSGKEVRLSHPIFYNGRNYIICITVNGSSGEVLIEGSKEITELVKEAFSSIESIKATNVWEALNAFYEAILAYYHRELADLDSRVEKIVHEIMNGKAKAFELFEPYNRLSRIHKGLHGLIYSLRKLSSIEKSLENIMNDTIMIEGMCSSLLQRVTDGFSLYYTITGEKTNSVVTKLTIISAIFLPLTLITGIYGMNFRYMPELYHPLGYPLTLLAMAIIALGEIVYFKKKKWI